MSEADNNTGNRRGTAPYVGFPSFKNMLGGFREHVLPSRIDRSVLSNFSGIVGSQLLSSLRFFHHIDEQGKPTENLQDLIAAHGTEAWASELRTQLERAYAPIFELDLQSASPAQFNERFKAAYPAEGDTLRKALTFFLNATREAQILVSPFIMKNKKPRSGTGQRKPGAGRAARQPKKPAAETPNKPNDPTPNGSVDTDSAFKNELLAKFPAFDPSWPDEIKAQWFKGFDQFMGMTKK